MTNTGSGTGHVTRKNTTPLLLELQINRCSIDQHIQCVFRASLCQAPYIAYWKTAPVLGETHPLHLEYFEF